MRIKGIAVLPNSPDFSVTVGVELMNETDKYIKVVSLLMQYPDEAYFRTLPEIKSLVAKMPRGLRRASIEKFISRLEGEDAIHLQEQYTALFDMSPSATLNVTYHLWGDGEKRACLLTRLQQEYDGAGLQKKSLELPDFLPLILEFLASVPRAAQSGVIKTSLKGVETLVERLKPIASHYSGLLEPLIELIMEPVEGETVVSVTYSRFSPSVSSEKANFTKADRNWRRRW
jgi:nitrate reductase delta subunit